MAAKLVVLISGSGSNLQALIDAVASGAIPNATIVLVVSNKKAAFGLERARSASIRTAYMNLIPYSKNFPSDDPNIKYGQAAREAYDKDLADLVLDAKPDMVICAGWMHILSKAFLEPLAHADVPVINLHPALPGSYDGAGAIERAFNDYQLGLIKHTGVMIHEVIQEVDRGRTIIEREVEIKPSDKLEDLETRIHGTEHILIVEGTRLELEALLARKR